MPKKRSNAQSCRTAGTRENNPATPCFPDITPKNGLVCRVLLESQIVTINVSSGYTIITAHPLHKLIGQ